MTVHFLGRKFSRRYIFLSWWCESYPFQLCTSQLSWKGKGKDVHHVAKMWQGKGKKCNLRTQLHVALTLEHPVLHPLNPKLLNKAPTCPPKKVRKRSNLSSCKLENLVGNFPNYFVPTHTQSWALGTRPAASAIFMRYK